MPDLDGVGEAATGGLAARAVEPQAGEADGHTHERACLNCRTPLIGDFCHACGQKAHVHRTIAAWWHDLLHGVLHLDGKIWRTLPLLAWHPGQLTRRYVEGERASFVSPLALFLFSVFLMFAVFSATGSDLIGDPSGIQQEAAKEGSELDRRIAALEKQRVEASAAGRPTAEIDARIREAREELTALRALERGDLKALENASVSEPDEPNFSGAPPAAANFFEQAYRRAKENPSLLFYKLQTNAYKFSWALIPLSVPFLWLLFLHRRRYRERFSGYDHFVFITYSIAAMSLALIAFVLLRLAGLDSGILNLILVLVPPVHIYRQLRGAYSLSRWSAAWRTAVLLWFAAIVLTLFGLMLLTVGILS